MEITQLWYFPIVRARPEKQNALDIHPRSDALSFSGTKRNPTPVSAPGKVGESPLTPGKRASPHSNYLTGTPHEGHRLNLLSRERVDMRAYKLGNAACAPTPGLFFCSRKFLDAVSTSFIERRFYQCPNLRSNYLRISFKETRHRA
jgi:hypothetical protein